MESFSLNKNSDAWKVSVHSKNDEIEFPIFANYTILHHMSDMDGFMSGALVKMALIACGVHNIDTIPCTYNKFPDLELAPNKEKYNVCIVTDLWYNPFGTHMKAFFKHFDLIVFIDHHSPSLDEAKKVLSDCNKNIHYLYSDLPATAFVYDLFREHIEKYTSKIFDVYLNKTQFVRKLSYAVSEFDISLSSEQIRRMQKLIFGEYRKVQWIETLDYEYYLRYISKYTSVNSLINGIIECKDADKARTLGLCVNNTYDIISKQIVDKYEITFKHFKNEFKCLNEYDVFAVCAPNFNNSSLFKSVTNHGIFMTISITKYGLSVNLFSKILDLRKLGFNGHASEAGISIPKVYDIKYIGEIE